MTPLELARSRLLKWMTATDDDRGTIYDDNYDLIRDKWIVVADAMLTSPTREEAIEAAKWWRNAARGLVIDDGDGHPDDRWPWLVDSEDHDE